MKRHIIPAILVFFIGFIVGFRMNMPSTENPIESIGTLYVPSQYATDTETVPESEAIIIKSSSPEEDAVIASTTVSSAENIDTAISEIQDTGKALSATNNDDAITENFESQEQNSVWISKSGKKYHATPDCSGMKNSSKISQAEAREGGYTPCKKCFKNT